MTSLATLGTQSPTPSINHDVRNRVLRIIDEMNGHIMDRAVVIEHAWVGRIAQLHLLMLGPGGIGKSYLSRSLYKHIAGATFFETVLDELTSDAQVLGPIDIAAMVQDRRTKRILDGMLGDCTDAMVDELFNANTPLLHSMMPALNERLLPNGRTTVKIPLRQCLMGTNQLDADVAKRWVWDRIHLREIVGPINSRELQQRMVEQAMLRFYTQGRGQATGTGAERTQVTLEELDAAHREALVLDVPPNVWEMFLDIFDNLALQGIEISNRRQTESMLACKANAWLRGHTSLEVGDLDILAAMWWNTQEERPTARETILSVTNPGEMIGLKLLEDLDKLQREQREVETDTDSDPRSVRMKGVEVIRNMEKLLRDATRARDEALEAGQSTNRLDEVISKSENAKDTASHRLMFGANA